MAVRGVLIVDEGQAAHARWGQAVLGAIKRDMSRVTVSVTMRERDAGHIRNGRFSSSTFARTQSLTSIAKFKQT